MKRRSFVKSSITGSFLPLGVLATTSAEDHSKSKKDNQQFYELRIYTLKDQSQQQTVESYLEHALIPAYNKAGSKNIGVFTDLKPEGQTKLYLLIPFQSLNDLITIPRKVEEDVNYQKAGETYLTAPPTTPAYERIQSSLLYAFTGMPRIEPPANKPRIFELRRYESPNESAGKKKIEMFNSAGEIPLFRRVGLQPVFFGESIIGESRPNLTYLLVFDDMAAHDSAWKTFSADPEWKKLSGMPEYADSKIISKITSTFLQPSAYSQI